jgi:uncharacterized protein YpuA (DUF1002 family)
MGVPIKQGEENIWGNNGIDFSKVHENYKQKNYKTKKIIDPNEEERGKNHTKEHHNFLQSVIKKS